MSGFSPAAGLKNGQFNRKRNEGIKNPNFQAPPVLKIGSNKFKILMTETSNLYIERHIFVWDLCFWSLDITCYLGFVICFFPGYPG